ncbi:hypothetical protein G6O67_008561 [Ophiocordyceps sinensis]|uniref:Uncharacterized protein n=1 Tax=Ophiocordyceps sinensis TaxID=72228 RepID=A0A8H4PI04_9HYPO|nr:hypothetical protein G6O67_008895 [Ophiocordyceps sinensis]KAF4503933.1 hypothetical protein G6O67_008561 [Ophiocordyceps sinensis]
MYLIVLPCVTRPVLTLATMMPSPFSVRIRSAQSLATLAPESTEMPTSAFLRAMQSLMPSPSIPTQCPAVRRLPTTRAFCCGVSLAKTVHVLTVASNSGVFSSSASCGPVTACTSSSVSSPTPTSPSAWHTLSATGRLSPVSTLICTPSALSCAMAKAASSLGGSMKLSTPSSVMRVSSPPSPSSSSKLTPDSCFSAMSSTRYPSLLSASDSSTSVLFFSGVSGTAMPPWRTVVHSPSTSSKAPLQMSRFWPVAPRTIHEERRRSNVKGIAATFSYCATLTVFSPRWWLRMAKSMLLPLTPWTWASTVASLSTATFSAPV